MARAIPTYDRKFLAAGVQGGGKAQSSVMTESPMGAALANMGASMGKLSVEMGQEQKKAQADRAAIDVANVLSQGEVYWQEDFANRAKAWSPGGADMREGIGKDFDKWASENEQKLPTEAAKNYFRQHSISMKTRMQTNAFSYQEKSTTDKLNADTVVAEQADENVVFADPARFADVYKRRTETIIARTDLPDAEKIRQADVYKRKLSLAVERGEMERDPAGWYNRRFGDPGAPGVAPTAGAGSAPAAGFDNVMVGIFKSEGGYAANDGNTGAPVNFGINQKANPDIDVKNLTKAEAAKLYKARYWDKIGGDSLPPALQGTAMDAAVNQGPARASAWIKESGGDPVKFNELRRAHYESLLAKPENAKFRGAWMKRLGEYEAQAGGGAPGSPARMAVAADAPRSFAAMDWEQQSALKSQAETRIKQDESKVVANVVGTSALDAVAGQTIGAERNVDIQKATETALAQAEAKIGKKLDDGQRDQIAAAVTRQASIVERDRARAQENTASTMLEALDKNGGDLQELRKTMPAEFDKLPRAVVDRVQKYAGAVATGETRETDWVAYTDLVQNPRALVAVNLSAVRDKFSAPEYNQLVKLQDATKKAIEKGLPDQTIMGDMAVVKGMLSDAKITDNKKEGMFFAALQREMDMRREANGGKPLKQAEIKEIAADLLVKEVTSKGLLWDSKTPAFEITVPPVERAKIQAALESRGLPVNESTILRAYRNKLNRAPAAAPTPAAPRPTQQSASGVIRPAPGVALDGAGD